MNWTFRQKAPKHRESNMPHGYFIVLEEQDDGTQSYVVYQDSYDRWRNVVGDPSIKMGEYATLKEAKSFTL